jgi:C1A family cysteine protease
MSKTRQLTLGALAVMTLATTAACGHAGTMPTGIAAQSLGENGPVIMAAGTARKLGFDMHRYQTVFAPHAHKQHLTRQGVLPGNVDLRAGQAPVYDQGKLGACTAFSIGKGFREFLQRKNGETQTPLSAMWLYYNERAAQGTVKQDSGSTLSEGFSILHTKGIATDASCPYDITKFTVKPSAAADATAPSSKIANPVQLATLDDVKAQLASGYDVSFGFTVHASFRNIKADGMMPIPAAKEAVLGGHAVTAVGYDDAKQVVVVRNSWSATWGDQGYFYMPYAVFSKDADDCWSAKN